MEASMATGVAMARAQEQATTRTAAAARGLPPMKKVRRAMERTTGRYQVANRSAVR